MTLEQRLTKIERELSDTRTELEHTKRRQRQTVGIVGIAVAGCVFIAVAMRPSPAIAQAGGDDVPRVVRAREFRVVDKNGKNRAVLCVVDDLVGLIMYDKHGNIRSMLGVDNDGPSLYMNDASSNTRVSLSVSKTGTHLQLDDDENNSSVMLWADKDDVGLSLNAENGKVRQGQDLVIWKAAACAPAWTPLGCYYMTRKAK